MPFASHRRPSIQVGLLKAIVEQHGFTAATYHCGVDFAVLIGQKLYEGVAQLYRHDQLGDWLFSVEAFREEAPDPTHELLSILDSRDLNALGTTPDKLKRLREITVPAYLDWLARSIDWSRYFVVGFTTTFQQTVASLALARRLKEQTPDLSIVFGGSNCEDLMGVELLTRTPWIDYVVLGEGDESFPQLLQDLAHGHGVERIGGLAYRREGTVVTTAAAEPFARLNDLPTPDYGEYFERAEALGVWSRQERHHVVIPFESARGCWWGMKAHCTFCGLNGKTMAFRAKTAARVQSELAELVARYSSFRLYAVDNIVSTAYLRDLFTQMRDGRTDYSIFYEVKSNLTRAELMTLKEAGVGSVQPGIESLSTPVLKLMKKGVSALQNINFLRWATCLGIDVTWLLLWGFPGERSDWYAEQASLMAKLFHLVPPDGGGRIRMERFSPIFNDPTAFPRRTMRPMQSYTSVYPCRYDLDRLAYFFEYEFEQSLPDTDYSGTESTMNQWIAAWAAEPRPSMTFWASPDLVLIEDSRDQKRAASYELTGLEAAVYRACSEAPVALCRVVQDVRRDDPDTVRSVLDGLVTEGLMVNEGTHYLAIALPASRR